MECIHSNIKNTNSNAEIIFHKVYSVAGAMFKNILSKLDEVRMGGDSDRMAKDLIPDAYSWRSFVAALLYWEEKMNHDYHRSLLILCYQTLSFHLYARSELPRMIQYADIVMICYEKELTKADEDV
eukprot:Awhi_evm2s4134